MNKRIVITIGRQYGSGGREIGKNLAEELKIPFYDKELLTVAAQKSGICEEMFETHDEKPTNSLLYSLVMGTYSGDNLPFNHKLFLAQFDAIRTIADEGSCVILGRCADYALEDYSHCVNVFIHANTDFRSKRAVEYYCVDKDKVKDVILKTDKQRSSYYNFYSSKKWGSVDNYDLAIDSSAIGIDGAVKIIKDFVKIRKDILREK